MRAQAIPQMILYAGLYREAQCPATPACRSYLWPARYFHFYVLFDRKNSQTCWLPEGYRQ